MNRSSLCRHLVLMPQTRNQMGQEMMIYTVASAGMGECANSQGTFSPAWEDCPEEVMLGLRLQDKQELASRTHDGERVF